MRFGRAAGSYHEATPVQKWMAESLAAAVPMELAPKSILELGCGTGHLTLELALRFPDARLLATDLSPAMLREAAARWPRSLAAPKWEQLDGRRPGSSSSRPDLVASNAMVQWFPDLREHFLSLRPVCRTGAVYALTGFPRGHFPELERILASDEFGYPPGPGHELSEAAQAAESTGWRVLRMRQESREESYPTPTDFLRHLKASGANRPPPDGKPLTRARLQRLIERLAAEAKTENGIGITWKPWFLLLEAA